MTRSRIAVPLIVAALFVLTGCIVEPRPYGYYRTYPGGVVYASPQPVAQPATQPVMPTTAPVAAPSAAQPTLPSDTPTPPGTPPIPSQEQPEVLTRGPVNEAFAQPVAMQNQPDVVAAIQPPASIVETPPSDRPADSACVWAPGYWSWDAERSNYIWVSGCWRLAPPKMTWVPGYWTRVPAGWQWVPGFWSPASAQEIAYLPAPPAVTDILPPGAPPTPDDFWVPGCWYWQQGRYALRAGYWLRQQPGWVWSPSYCAWTPRGYVAVEGHWDYALEHRGVLFAPVCFPGRVSAGVAISFSPSITVDVGVLSANLFACPRYAHYYFGDYYDDAYVRVGIYPWFDCVRLGGWYDPVFVYARWDHCRRDPRWEEHERHEYTLRHDDRNLRPPRTYREQETRVARLPEPQRHDQQMARPLNKVVAAPAAAGKFEHVDTAAHQKIVQQSAETHNFRDARSRWETAAPAPQAPASPPTTVTAKPSKPIAPSMPSSTPSVSSTPPARNTTAPTETQPDRGRLPAAPAAGPTVAPQAPTSQPTPVTAKPPKQTAPTSTPSTPSTPARDTTPTGIQPDRVRLPTSTAAGSTMTPRGNDHADRGVPDRPTDDYRRDR